MKKKKKLKRILIAAAFVAVLALIFFAALEIMLAGLPSISQLEDYTPNLSTKIYDKDNNLIAEFYTERRQLVPINEIPVNLQNAFIAIEDNDFYDHWGISTKGIMRAAFRALVTRRVAEGGSTITQQLAKTIFLTPEKTLTRKIKEILLTIQLEHEYSKEEILQFYINQIYFGNGAYGAQAASRIYFNKNVQDLTLAEAATLAAMPKSPNYYNPFKNPTASLNRRNTVIARMYELGFITKEEKEEAMQTPLPSPDNAQRINSGNYFVEYLRIMLEPKYGTDALYKGGLSIYTTLDIKAQVAAEKALNDALTNFDNSRAAYFKAKNMQPVKVQGALIAMDVKTGAIRAMVGGRDFKDSQFNRATQAKRQPGSSFKAFVYLAAIESGLTAATLLDDEPMVFINDGTDYKLVSRDPSYIENVAEGETEDNLINTNKIWMPQNYGNTFKGPVTLRTALALSINICAIETIMKVTPMAVIREARKLGITTPLTNTLSLALGSSDVLLQEMVSAYATLGDGGVKTTPYVINKITDKDGKILEQNIPQQQEVLSPQVCFVMTNMLKSVIERGSGWYAKNLGRPAAGKTGTTNESSDAWFIGYTPQLAAGVWVGYDDRTISLGANATGGVIACPIWTEFMKDALAGTPVVDFPQPDGIEWALVDPKTGLLALSKTPGAFLEAFIKGTAPTTYSNQQFTPAERAAVAGDKSGF